MHLNVPCAHKPKVNLKALLIMIRIFDVTQGHKLQVTSTLLGAQASTLLAKGLHVSKIFYGIFKVQILIHVTSIIALT